MKEKKSNLKNNNFTIEDEQKASINRLIGLFLIVYSILCFTTSDMSSILSVPFTFLFGSFTPIALLIVIFLGVYLLIKKKMFNSFSTIQYVLLSIILIFSLTLATATKSNETMTFSNCFSSYLGKNGVYNINFRLLADEANSVMLLGGGMIGYMFYGAINSMTGANYTITIVISAILLAGSFFILIAPLISKLIKFIKKSSVKNKEKKEQKRLAKEAKLKQKELLEKERLTDGNKPIQFNVSNKITQQEVDDLLETTEIDITGDDFKYSRHGDKKEKKLSSILNPFDEEIYPNSIKHPVSKNVDYSNSSEVKLTDTYSSDFKELEQENKNVVLSNNIEHVQDNNFENEENEVVLKEVINLNQEVKLDKLDMDVNSLQDKNIDQKIIYKEDEKVNIADSNVKTFTYNPVINETVIEKEEVIEEVSNKQIKEEQFDKIENEEPNNLPFNPTTYELPPLYLLKEPTDNGANYQNEEIAKIKAGVLMEKMRELNVSASINAFVVGPSVTRFEIALAPGVRVGSFTNLQEDFKLALGVNSIRIESPIPGKSAIGIEIPNQYRASVLMKEIITKMPNKKTKLFVPVGKDITGTPLSFPICNMPHCLISGATNSGKSVCANTIILSLLLNYKPNEVRLIMVDPKRVEMLFYKDIPHLMCPIITDSEKARIALEKLCVEMDKRFTTFSKVGVKNIASYNEMMEANNKEIMPFILLVVDEFAELMLCKNHNIVEEKIQKLAQLGRAAGIHLILSTQRPDVNVIPGTIKTNLPCRMTFRLSSLVDSRTVIDVGGAEKLLNNGDMLLLTPDFTGLRRVQGVFVSDQEISDVVEHCKKQCGPQYDLEFLDLRTPEEIQEEQKLKYALENNTTNDDSDLDPMYEEIKAFVIKEQKASTSFLQRKFQIGYGRAARIIDMLEDNGIIGPENGSKPREVLVSEEEDYDE